MASLFAATNRWQDAAGQLQAILKLRPGQLETRYRLVEALQQLGDHKGVARELSLCLLMDPRNAAAHYNLGVALALEGADREQAYAEFRRALELKPDYEDARKALDATLR
jgi:tetratricopeptide (TPR) repeat protein